MIHSEIRSYIHSHKKELFEKLVKARMGNEYKEENFRTNYAFVLKELFQSVGVEGKIRVENEFTVFEGRIDSLYGNFLIEYKYPTRISGSNKDVNKKFIEQVQRQINGFEIKTGIPSNRMMGVVFDGYYVIYIRKQGEGWDISMPQEMTVDSHEIFLMRLLSVNCDGKALITENLVRDFGSSSEQSVCAISMLYNKLANNTEYNKARLLFEQWQTLYREVCGYSFETKDIKVKNLKKQYELEGNEIHYAYLIFAIQTYFSLLIKILSLNILTYLKGSPFTEKYGFHAESLKELKNDFIELEEGGRFRRLGISNFLEGDLFSWYLYLWDEDISIFLQTLIETFSAYDYSIIILEKDIARDLLKNLYYELLPSVLRKNLGEFYTPDWLAEFLVEDAVTSINKDSVFLDPTCGSGTFLVILIKKLINLFGDDCTSEELLKIIVNHVRGYDLNPLAVICARANYLIALGGLLSDLETPIEIPVYLCDAMLTVLEGYEENEGCYIIPTKAEVFMIPKKLVDIKNINNVLDLVNECIRRGVGKNIFEKQIKINLPMISGQLSEREYQILLNFYGKMEELNRRNLDGVWANVIKNAFAPVFQEKVDYIIGNPPWIDWQNLPENYRDSIKKYWYDYRVFDHKGQKARLGSAHDDISVLMTYVIMDHFLKDGGSLAFVINQNLLQASGGGDGFRKFMIKEKIPVGVKSVNDFVEAEPFRSLGVSNKTATIVLKKNEKTQYPVIYKKWYRCGTKTIDANETKEAVFSEKIKEKVLYASPIKEYHSPWLIASLKDKEIFEKMVNWDSDSSYRARKGVDTSANAIFWVKERKKVNSKLVFINNSPERSRKGIKQICDFPIEKDILYPLLRGKDVKRWRYDLQYSILLPYTCDGKVIAKEELLSGYPNAFDYFFEERHAFSAILRERATYQKLILKQDKDAPEYALYDIGKYTFSPYKVIWKALHKGVCAVTVSKDAGRMIIPDHNLLMIPLEDETEAYYLSGVLNADIVSRFVNAHVAWFISGHILERIKIPKYSKDNKIHKEIADLSKKAHMEIDDEEMMRKIEIELDEKVETLLLK